MQETNKYLDHIKYVNKILISYWKVREGFIEQGPHQMNLKRIEQRQIAMGKGQNYIRSVKMYLD